MNLDLSQYKISPVTMIFLKDNDRVLTLHRSPRKQIYPNKISGFGGKVEPGEDLFSAARREFLEETGLSITDPVLKGTLIRIVDNGYVAFIYIFVVTKFTGQVLGSTEEGVISWMRVGDFLKTPDRVDHIGHYLEQVLEDNSDFYSGIAVYSKGQITQYADNRRHFQDRKSK